MSSFHSSWYKNYSAGKPVYAGSMPSLSLNVRKKNSRCIYGTGTFSAITILRKQEKGTTFLITKWNRGCISSTNHCSVSGSAFLVFFTLVAMAYAVNFGLWQNKKEMCFEISKFLDHPWIFLWRKRVVFVDEVCCACSRCALGTVFDPGVGPFMPSALQDKRLSKSIYCHQLVAALALTSEDK